MIKQISVEHPVIKRLDCEPFWFVGKDGLKSSGGEYFARRNMGNLDAEAFFTILEGTPTDALQHTLSSVFLVANHLRAHKPDKHVQEHHTVNASLSGLILESAAERILSCMGDNPNLRPTIEVTEMRRDLSERAMRKIEKNVRHLRQHGVDIFLDDVDDNGEIDPRWNHLFQHAAGIKLAAPMTKKILDGGLDSLSTPARRMVVDSVQDDRILVVEAVSNRADAIKLASHFKGFTQPLMQGHNLNGEKRHTPRHTETTGVSRSLVFTA